MTLASIQQQVRDRNAALGLSETPAMVDAMRNKGAERTEAKRELLRRIERRARAAGLEPIVANH